MPRIPTFEQQAQLPTTTSPFLEKPSTEVGRALQGLGQDVFKRGLELKRERDVLAAADAYTKFQDNQREFMVGERNRLGAQSDGAQQRGQEFYDKQIEEIGGSLSRQAKRIFTQKVMEARNNGLDNLAAHQSKQHQIRKENKLSGLTSQLQADIRAGTVSKGDVTKGIQDIKEFIQEMYKGLDTTHIENSMERSMLMEHLNEVAQTNPDDLPQLLRDYAGKVDEKEIRAIKELADKVAVEQRVDAEFEGLQAQHGVDFEDMLKGITKGKYKNKAVRDALKDKVRDEWSQAVNDKKRIDFERQQVEGEDIVNDWANGHYATARQKVLRSRHLTPAQKEHWIDKIDRMNESIEKSQEAASPFLNSDPNALFLASKAIALNPDAVENDDIWRLVGKGLSTKDGVALQTRLKTAKAKDNQRIKEATRIISAWKNENIWESDDVKNSLVAAQLQSAMMQFMEDNPDADPITDFLQPHQKEITKLRFKKAFQQLNDIYSGKVRPAQVPPPGKHIRLRGRIPQETVENKFYKAWLGKDLSEFEATHLEVVETEEP